VATLVANAADPVELDHIATRLGAASFVEHASWTMRSLE
jgi:hypothetical protein